MKIVFEDNSFIGVSVDEYNNKEYVISSENGTETYFTEKTGDFLSKHFCYMDLLRRRLNQLTFMHKTAADKRKAGTFDETEWHESLINYDTEFYKLWDKIKNANSPPGN